MSTSAPLRLLFIGDVLGRSGRAALSRFVPRLREKWALDFIVVNGENAAGGFGITEAICDEMLGLGVDCVTLGNHAFDQREALVFIERQPRLLRPINYPPGTPGRGAGL
jgi:calcineurin-like phosphoesterase